MINLRKQRLNILYNLATTEIVSNGLEKKEKIIIISGVLNYLWSQWCFFWRSYWIVILKEGIDLEGKYYKNRYLKLSNNEDAKNIVCRIVKSKKSNSGSYKFYEEPTWGSPECIEKIAYDLIKKFSRFVDINKIQYLSSLLGQYKNHISNFQKIRNTFIHMTPISMKNLKQEVTSIIIFGKDQQLVDILFAHEVNRSEEYFDTLKNSFRGMLLHL